MLPTYVTHWHSAFFIEPAYKKGLWKRHRVKRANGTKMGSKWGLNWNWLKAEAEAGSCGSHWIKQVYYPNFIWHPLPPADLFPGSELPKQTLVSLLSFLPALNPSFFPQPPKVRKHPLRSLCCVRSHACFCRPLGRASHSLMISTGQSLEVSFLMRTYSQTIYPWSKPDGSV